MSARGRRAAAPVWPSLGPLHVGDELLRVRPRNDGDELPPVIAPVVQNLLGRVRQQRHGDVLPLGHGQRLSSRYPSSCSPVDIPTAPSVRLSPATPWPPAPTGWPARERPARGTSGRSAGGSIAGSTCSA